MDPPVLQSVKPYTNNNERLPDDVMEDLQRVLAKPRQELAVLEAEIKELKERLTQLEVKRDRVQKSIAQYECVLAPIRRLPADILHDIFYHCLPTRRDLIMSVEEAPILLTRICRTWRQIAHASPPIWARIFITFSDEDILQSFQDAEITHKLTHQFISDTLRLRCIAVDEWLSRSGASPLSISLYYTSHIWSPNDGFSPGNSEHTRTLFRILARHSPHWQRLELKMPIEVYQILETMVPLSQLQMLNSIRTSFVRQVDMMNGPQEPAITFWHAPNLKKISLDGYSSPINSIFSAPNLAKLTNLSIILTISIAEAISLLKDCPNLECAMLDLALQTGFVPSTQSQSVISLPHLRALCIKDTAHPEYARMFYECIDAPQMEWLYYINMLNINHYIGPNQTSVENTSITALLQRLTNLKKLTITGRFLSFSELRKILRSAQSLKHLVLGPKTRTNREVSEPSLVSASSIPIFDLGDLFLEDGGYNSPGLPLLPRLEILEISQPASSYLTDEVLRDIILNRSNLVSSKDVARLKKVAVLFSRTKKIDVAKELSTHSIAGKVELQLEYFNQAPWHDILFVSSGYGMELDPLWQSYDIEEEVGTICFSFRRTSQILRNLMESDDMLIG